MKWAHVPERDDPLALLIWAFTFAVRDTYHSISENMQELFEGKGEIGGDPGWEIDRHADDIQNEYFEIWVDPRVSEVEESHCVYDGETVRRTMHQILEAFANTYPQSRKEAMDIIRRYHL